MNTRSGKRRSGLIPPLVERTMAGVRRYELVFWRGEPDFAHAMELLASGEFGTVVAAGGDGTVNRVAAAAAHHGIPLGILPAGSGNGLARSLGVPLDPLDALQMLINAAPVCIDAASVNGRPFFCTSGAGFDAHVGKLFAHAARRGLAKYIGIVMTEWRRYKPQVVEITANGHTIRRKAFLVTVANAGQYGNNFYIAPQASMTDGLLDVVIVQPLNLWSALSLLAGILRRKAHLNPFIETFRSNEIRVVRADPGPVHCDGEPWEETPVLEFKIKPLSLLVYAGPSFASSSR